MLATLRKGLTKLETADTPLARWCYTVWTGRTWSWCGLPANAVEHLSLPHDPATRRRFGVPVVAVVGEAAGVGHVPAPRRSRGRHRHSGVWGVQWSESSNSDDFSKNLIRAGCEGRFGTSVLSPLGGVTLDLTA